MNSTAGRTRGRLSVVAANRQLVIPEFGDSAQQMLLVRHGDAIFNTHPLIFCAGRYLPDAGDPNILWIQKCAGVEHLTSDL